MTQTLLTFDLGINDPAYPLNFQVLLDDCCVYTVDVDCDSIPVEIVLPDDENSHVLKFCLQGKTADHTQIDNNNNIVADTVVSINNLKIEGFEVGYNLLSLFEYYHDFNGTAPATVDKFWGVMGCNGTVELKFTSPVYLWLLENM